MGQDALYPLSLDGRTEVDVRRHRLDDDVDTRFVFAQAREELPRTPDRDLVAVVDAPPERRLRLATEPRQSARGFSPNLPRVSETVAALSLAAPACSRPAPTPR